MPYFFQNTMNLLGNLPREALAAIEELKHAESFPRGLKKLKGNTSDHPIYRYKTNDSSRLLFTIRHINGQHCLLVLDYLPTHDYQKSRFLRQGVLDQFLKLNETGLVERLNEEESYEPVSEAEWPRQAKSAEMLQVLQSTEQQKKALETTLPAIIIGPPGSGKTLVALEILSQYAASLDADIPERPHVLWLTKSLRLKNETEQAWFARNEATLLTVDFKTEKDLVDKSNPEKKTIQDEPYFQAWFNTRSKALKYDFDSNTAYRELRVRSGYTADAYKNIGCQQSSLSPQSTQREAICQLYTEYCSYLKKTQSQDPAFVRLFQEPCYDLVIVDEAQDLSRLQFLDLYSAAKNQRILYCADPHQDLMGDFSRTALCASLYEISGSPIPTIVLESSHRCPVAVIERVNQLLQMKRKCVGGAVDSTEASEILPHLTEHSTPGGFIATTPGDLIKIKSIYDKRMDPRFAVIIVHEDQRKRAAALFPSVQIFMPNEIKGLERDIIVVYGGFSTKKANDIAKYLTQSPSGKTTSHLARRDVRNTEFLTDFNELITAFIRSKIILVLCDDQMDPFFLNQFTKSMISATDELPPLDDINEAQTLSLWDKELHRLALEGDSARAQLVLERLAQPINQFPLYQAYLQQQRDYEEAEEKQAPNDELKTAAQKPAFKNAAEEARASILEREKAHDTLRETITTTITTAITTTITTAKAAAKATAATTLFITLLEYSEKTGFNWFETQIRIGKHKWPLLKHIAKNNALAIHFRDALSQLDIPLSEHNASKFFSLLNSYKPTQDVQYLIKSGLALHHQGSFTEDTSKDQWLWAMTMDNSKEALSSMTWLLERSYHRNKNYFFWLCSADERLERLKKLFDLDKKNSLINSINIESFNNFDTNTELPPLNLLMQNQAHGYAILAQFIYKNMKINIIPSLFSSDFGISLFCLLLRDYPALRENLRIDQLTALIKIESTSEPQHTVLSRLCREEYGITALSDLMTNNTQLLQQIQSEDITRPDLLAEEHQEMIPLFSLSSRKEGIALLLRLLEKKPDLIAAIEAEDLFSVDCTTIQIQTHTPISLFYSMCITEEGAKLLEYLLNKKPEFINNIDIDFLIKPVLSIDKVGDNLTPFAWLCSHQEGLHFFFSLIRYLLEFNSPCIPLIKLEHLTTAKIMSAQCNRAFTPFDLLCMSTLGIEVLERLLFSNQTLLTELFPKYFARQNNELTELSNLYTLCNTEAGLTFLLKMGPLLMNLSAHHLLEPQLTSTHGASSVLYLLTGTAEHLAQPVLIQIFENNPRLCLEITIQDLQKRYCDTNELDPSILSRLLSYTDFGPQILDILIKHNPSLADGMCLEDFTVKLFIEEDSEHKLSPLYWLCSSENGRKTLKKLLELNPQLLCGLRQEHLTEQEPRQEYANYQTPTLYYLSCSQDGCAILSQIFRRNPALYQSIPEEEWARTYTQGGAQKTLRELYSSTKISSEASELSGFSIFSGQTGGAAAEISTANDTAAPPKNTA